MIDRPASGSALPAPLPRPSAPKTPVRVKRRHPAARARTRVFVGSVAGLLGLTSVMAGEAVAHTVAASSSTSSTTSTSSSRSSGGSSQTSQFGSANPPSSTSSGWSGGPTTSTNGS